jgi:hypothetical protein
MFSTTEQPLYVFDHRKRITISAAALMAALFFEFYLTIVYKLPIVGADGSSQDGMLQIFLYTGIFAAFACYGLLKSKRIEFYQNFIRVISRLGVIVEIPYSEIYLSPFVQGKSFKMMRFVEGKQLGSWNLSNDKIWNPNGTSMFLYELISPKSNKISLATNIEIGSLDPQKTRRFEIFAIIGAGVIIVGAYFVYAVFAQIQQQINFGDSVAISSVENVELYTTALVGFGALILSMIYLRSAARKELSNVKVSFGRYGGVPASTTILVLIIFTTVVLAMVVTTIYFLPQSQGTCNSPESCNATVAPGMFMLGTVLAIIVLIIFYAMGLGGFLSAIGPYQRRKMLVATTILVCLSLIFPIIGGVFGQYSYSVDYNSQQELTSINVAIIYPGNATWGYLGASNQEIYWAGGGGAYFSGGQHFKTWIYLPYACCFNASSFEITEFSTLNQGFSVVSVSPSPPFHPADSSSLNISYTLVTPSNLNYTGPLYLQIKTT